MIVANADLSLGVAGILDPVLVAMSSKLGMSTTAEGVATEEQPAILVEKGCTEASGHLFSPFCPPCELDWLAPLPSEAD